jgi:hypothetical protein
MKILIKDSFLIPEICKPKYVVKVRGGGGGSCGPEKDVLIREALVICVEFRTKF